MSRAAHIAAWSGGVLLLTLAALVAALLAFDWNRARPWINRHVSEAIGRPFAIHGALSLTWDAPTGETGWRAWIPWPRLHARDITVGNPAWASDARMAQVKQVTFSVSPLPLLGKRIVIPSLALDTPQVAFERHKDGRNNWTFRPEHDDDRKWRLDLQRLILNRGAIRWIDAGRRIDLAADISSLGDGNGDYRIGWRVTGSINGEQVTGDGRAGAILSLKDKEVPYPIEASLRLGKTRIDAQGKLTEPLKLASVDLKLRIAGVSMAHLYPVTGVALPETRPFWTEGRLVGKPRMQGGNWIYEKFTGKMGASEVAGTVRYQWREPRPLLEGTVESRHLNIVDLAPLIGADSNASRRQRGVKAVQPENRVFPVERFKTERWKSIDADVQFSARKIVRREELPIDNLVTRVRLDDGVLSLAPLKFDMAGGSFVSNVRLDGRSDPVKGELRMSARHVKLRELFPSLVPMRTSVGEINADAALTASGNSVASLLSAANGELKAVINEGAVSKLLLERMGMNLGSVVATQLFGDRQVKLNCAVADFDVKKGILHARAFVIDTEDAAIHVNGTIDLAQERLALAVLPESKGLRLMSLRAPLHVSGRFKKPDVAVDKGVLAAKAGGAIALGALAPAAAALLPLVNVGPGAKSECSALLAQATARPDTPAAGRNGINASGK